MKPSKSHTTAELEPKTAIGGTLRWTLLSGRRPLRPGPLLTRRLLCNRSRLWSLVYRPAGITLVQEACTPLHRATPGISASSLADRATALRV